MVVTGLYIAYTPSLIFNIKHVQSGVYFQIYTWKFFCDVSLSLLSLGKYHIWTSSQEVYIWRIHVHLSNVLMQVLRWYIFVFYADQTSDAEVFPMEDWQPAWSGKLIYLDSMSCLMITCVVYEYFWVAIGGLYMHVVMVPMCLRAYLHVVCRTPCISIVFLTTCTICMGRIQ